MRRAFSALLLGAVVMASDSPAVPDRIERDPGSVGAPQGEDPDALLPPDAHPTAVEKQLGPVLDLGVIRFDTGLLEATPEPGGGRTRGLSRLVDDRPDVGDNDAMLRDTAIREAAREDDGARVPIPERPAGESAKADARKPRAETVREVIAEVADVVTHPFAFLAVFICLGAWLAAKLMDKADRLRTANSRLPGRRRRGGRSRRR